VLSRHLERWVEKDAEAILSEWRGRDALRGREISWDDGSGEGREELSGVADGVDERGNLLVVAAGGDRVALGAGEVHLRL
jgi:biotin-(acetyl-CoA carboxylase) ligase